MAELAKKMNFKNASGVITQAKLYSTTSEAGSDYQILKVDGVTAYVSVGATSDSNATSGRFKKSGTTKAYLKQGGIPYTEVSWTTPGTYTWICPNGVTKVRVAVIAGGGSYSGGDDEYVDENNYVYSATDSRFHNTTATVAQIIDGGEIPGVPNGRVGTLVGEVNLPANGEGFIEGERGFGLDFDINSIGAYGSGATFAYTNFYSSDILLNVGLLPGTGGKAVEYVSVVPGQTYEVVVGRCLDFHVFYTGVIAYSLTGTDGAVLLAYGGNISSSDGGDSGDSGSDDVVYTEVSYTSGGTHTFTVPTGVTRLRVAVCGGGGGGATDSSNTASDSAQGDSGGASSFGSLVTATGGEGAYNSEWYEDTENHGGTGWGGDGGTPNGRKGGNWSSPPVGFARSFDMIDGAYGQGGRGNYNGGSGGYNCQYVTVTSGRTYAITVGKGGAGGKGNSGAGGSDGTIGFVLIAYGGDI